LRLGLIGLGQWGLRYAQTIARLPEMSLCSVATGRSDVDDCALNGVEIVPHWTELSPKVLDAVIVANASRDHGEAALWALRAGLPVLVEKPMGCSAGEARLLIREARRNSVPLLVGLTHLYARPFERLLNLTRLGGGAQFIEGVGGNRGPYRPDISSLWDYGPHDLAMVIKLARSLPCSLAASLDDEIGGTGQNTNIELSFPNGCRAKLKVGNAIEPKTRTLAVQTLDGRRLVYDDLAPDKLRSQRADGDYESVALGTHLMPLDRMILALVRAVRMSHRSHWSAALGEAVTGLLERVDAKIAQGAG
jgi:predicted dehydrogenase